MNDTSPTTSRSTSRLRAVISALMIIVALILAPVASVGTWARVQLVDTDQFVATFAPLADDPAVQTFVADQITDQINEQVDFKQIIGDVFAGIAEANLPPRAATAIASLEAPAVAGIQSLVASTTQRIVASDQFAELWEESLRVSHKQITALLKDQPGTALQVSNDGTLSLELGPLIDAVKQRLVERGLSFADKIPVKDRSIAIVHADSLGLARVSYQIAVIGGYWLPWLALGLLIGGILVANRKRRAVVISSIFFAIIFGLMTMGVWIGGNIFVFSVSPNPLPSSVAHAIFDQVTAMMDSTLRALTFLGVLVAVVAWFAGPSRPATATRSVLGSGFASLRGALDRAGGDTRGFGRFLDKNRNVILIVAIALGMAALFASRPVTFTAITWLVIALIVVAIAVEVLRRPEGESESVGTEKESQPPTVDPANESSRASESTDSGKADLYDDSDVAVLSRNADTEAEGTVDGEPADK
ncbi:hypothetical protein [Gordonia neofelifaecis]|uniref:Integral membrane protein n=1 Tax=Gordonia neofelifaecis NRRL B-59395 TaxID=644548 RepID=F1YF11_9ACTN|nr:hypothetical protein [Gordonia neofelifaecis]EGD56351.1 hypothetical protein SCNU_02322 [Gordonia neofelifaecis NRRL B-59395]